MAVTDAVLPFTTPQSILPEPANSTEANVSAPFVGVPVSEVARVIFIIVGLLEIVSTVGGNSLLLAVLFTGRSVSRGGFHYLFIANLAVADLLCLGYCMTFLVLDLILGRQPVVDEAHCDFNGFFLYICTAVSILSLLSVTLNRYLLVCHNHLYSRVFTLRRIVISCLLLWFTAAVGSIPPLAGVGAYGYDHMTRTCGADRNVNNKYLTVVAGLFCVVPIFFVGYWNFAIFRRWKNDTLSIEKRYPAATSVGHDADNSNDGQFMVNTTTKQFQTRIDKERAKERALIRSLLVIFVLTIICFLPHGVARIVQAVRPHHRLSAEGFIAIFLALYFNCSVNWIVYGVMNRSFRRGYVKLVKRAVAACCRCCPKRSYSPDRVAKDIPMTTGASAGSDTAGISATQSSGV